MKFNEYYNKYRNSNDIYKNLKNARNNLLNGVSAQLKNGPKEEDINALQTFLTGAFYPTSSNKNEYSDVINKMITDLYQKKYDMTLREFDIGKQQVDYGVEDLEKMVRERYEAFSHKEYITVKTLEERRRKVKEKMEGIAKQPKTQQLKKLENDLKEMEKSLDELLRLAEINSSLRGSVKVLNFKGNNDYLKKVEEMDKQFEALSHALGILPPEDFGRILEYSLNAMNKRAEEISSVMTDELAEAITDVQGSKTVRDNESISSKIELLGKKQLNSLQGKIKMVEGKKIKIQDGKKSLSIDYNSSINPDTSRQGKMDVLLQLDLPNSNYKSPFRISAKNWSNPADRDFGNTALAYALLRSLDREDVSLYMYVLQDENTKGKMPLLQEAHDLAKMSIIADILIGYSQKAQYADTLVINDRKNKKVIVKSLNQVYTDLNNSLEGSKQKLYIDGYEQGEIRNNFLNILGPFAKEQSPGTRSDTFYKLGLNYLYGIKVALKFNNIKHVIK